MNFSEIIKSLNSASLFDLYRLNAAIQTQLDDPKRHSEIKRQLKPGMEIRYFDSVQNRLVDAVVIESKRTKVSVKNRDDGEYWRIPFYWINLENITTNVEPEHRKRVDRNSLKVGDQVCFRNRRGDEIFGEVFKLNPKSAGVRTNEGEWRVAYGLLESVIDGEAGIVEGELLIENHEKR